MIKIHFVFILLTVLSCRNAGSEATRMEEISKQDEVAYNVCDFKSSLSNLPTPQLAKSIFLKEAFDFTNEDEAMALIDSLNAKDQSSRPFYFKVITLAYKKSDGYLSEALGIAAKGYVEKNTEEFAAHFDNRDCFSKNDLATWADMVLLEMKIESENIHNISAIDNFINSIEYSCKSCSQNQKHTIDKFAEILRSKWK